MKKYQAIRFMAVLLFGLLVMQIDPGGAVVCMADNGSVSYSLNCACDQPGNNSETGCLACAIDTGSSKSCCPAEASLPSCCSSDGDGSDADDPPKKSCCSNFSIDMLVADSLQLSPLGYTLADSTGPLALDSIPADGTFQLLIASLTDLPPPCPDRLPDNLLQLNTVRLLL